MLERVVKKSFFRPGPPSRPRLFAVGLLLVVLSSLGLTVSASLASASVTERELSVHRLVNEHRAAQGLTPLALSPEISAIARVHSEDMASGRAAGGHAGADARVERISHSIPYREFGENVAAINQGGEGEAAVSGWLQSPGHRSNIEGSFDLTGIGIARSEDGTYFFTQLFVTPATHSSPVPLPTPEPAHSPEAQPPPAEVDAAPSLFAQLAWALLGLAWELWGFAVDLLWGLAGDLFAPAAPPLAVDPPAVTPPAVPPPVPQPAHSPGAHPTPIAVDPPPHSSAPVLPGPLAPPAAPPRVPQTYGSRPAYNYKPPSRNHRPEKDPRRRPGRRRTMDGWVQKLE